MNQKKFNYIIYSVLAWWIFSRTSKVWTQQTLLLQAIGSKEAYMVINDKLADNGNAVEVSDWSHSNFGSPITQVFDEVLKKHVFRFHIHPDQDTDRCKKSDGQRTEIKVYDKSPDWLKGLKESKFVYKWKFRLDKKFQPSRRFTHLFQIEGSRRSIFQPSDDYISCPEGA